ncbi:MAG: helix-turn-helix domain-containing protein [Candidatus Micrarchaeota archaeon]
MECEMCKGKSKYSIRSCAVNKSLMLIGSKWILPILLELKIGGRTRFNELQRILFPISAKILSKRLKTLNSQGLVRKEESASSSIPKVSYYLTKKGDELIASINPILKFSEKYEDKECKLVNKLKTESVAVKPKHDSFLHV